VAAGSVASRRDAIPPMPLLSRQIAVSFSGMEYRTPCSHISRGCPAIAAQRVIAAPTHAAGMIPKPPGPWLSPAPTGAHLFCAAAAEDSDGWAAASACVGCADAGTVAAGTFAVAAVCVCAGVDGAADATAPFPLGAEDASSAGRAVPAVTAGGFGTSPTTVLAGRRPPMPERNIAPAPARPSSPRAVAPPTAYSHVGRRTASASSVHQFTNRFQSGGSGVRLRLRLLGEDNPFATTRLPLCHPYAIAPTKLRGRVRERRHRAEAVWAEATDGPNGWAPTRPPGWAVVRARSLGTCRSRPAA